MWKLEVEYTAQNVSGSQKLLCPGKNSALLGPLEGCTGGKVRRFPLRSDAASYKPVGQPRGYKGGVVYAFEKNEMALYGSAAVMQT